MIQKVKGHDEAPALIQDHKFRPKGEWWSLCVVCNLSEAAHKESELVNSHIGYYSDDAVEA